MSSGLPTERAVRGAMAAMAATQIDLETAMQRELARLCADFQSVSDRESIEQCVRGYLAEFKDARVKRFVPILVSRLAREHLGARLRERIRARTATRVASLYSMM